VAQEPGQQPQRELRRGAELDGGAIAVRNSRHPSGPALVYTRAEIDAFLIGVKNGEFDDLGLSG
jgi:Domain of unknown function (DUF397).